jgi:2-polyprenyl-6-methoxyphenol hydroxylase-like FAD-dependent oxidoreductase
MSGIEDVVHFGHEVTGYRQDHRDIVLELSGGRTARGTVLVAADGINSAIRRQFLTSGHLSY